GDVSGILRQLPGVADVAVAVRADAPARRIVHLRDWHLVPRDQYAAELRAARPGLSDSDVDRLYRELTLEVEAVQLEQMAFLRCLIRHHGLRRVCAEGLTERNLPDFRERVEALRTAEREQVPRYRKLVQEALDLKPSAEAADVQRKL